MNRLTLDEIWKRSLAMWEWIVRMWRISHHESIWRLKETWLKDHEPKRHILSDCYFCEWQLVHTGKYQNNFHCQGCPGYKVDPGFHCMASIYHYSENPAAFLAKIKELNAKRLAGKKRQANRRSKR